MADCRLMLHFNGSNGQTNTVDRTGRHSITFNGTAQLSTTNPKFGTACLLLDGDSDSLTLANSEDWNILSDNTESWTIDLWVKFVDHDGTEYLVEQIADTNNRWVLSHAGGSGFAFAYVYNGTATYVMSGVGEVSDTLWHHIALVKIANIWGLYLDSVQIGYANTSVEHVFAGALRIGEYNSSAYFYGRIDELRIDKSNHFNASPNSGLTDTIEVFVPAGHWELDDDAASTAVADDSGNGNAGTLKGGDNTEDLSRSTDRGDSLAFDGSVDDITVGLQTELQWGSGDGTVLAWIKISSANKPVASADCVACCGNYSGKGYFLYIGASGAIDFRIDDGTNLAAIVGDTDICDSELHLIAGVRNGSQIEVYLDGVSDKTPVSSASVGDIDDATYGFSIAALNNNGEANGNNIAAILQGIQTYPGVALTAAQLLAMYNDGIEGKATPRAWEGWELLPEFPSIENGDISRGVEISPFSADFAEDGVRRSNFSDGYPLVDPRYTFQQQSFGLSLTWLSDTDKDTLTTFYKTYAAREIAVLNPTDSLKYHCIFEGAPKLSVDQEKGKWKMTFTFRQVSSTTWS